MCEKIASALLAAAVLSGQEPQPARKPFLRLFTMVFTEEARRVNNLPSAERERVLDDLTRWYVHFHTEHSNEFTLGDPTRDAGGVTLAERLTRRGAMVSGYRNGSYVSQAVAGDMNSGEAADLERRAPLAISTWWPGHKNPNEGGAEDGAARLAAAVDQTTPLIEMTSPAGHKSSNTPDTWPYLPSRGRGSAPGNVNSTSSHDVVSWIRLDDEILRIREVTASGGRIRLVVDRGYFSTGAAAHAAGARVFSPVYIGSAAAVGWDRGLAGSPPVDRPDRPLRYAVRIWQDDGIAWLAGRIRNTFGAGQPAPYFQGYNAVWLDITSCAAYNNADAYGNPVTPWDNPNDALMTPDRLGEYQARKVAELKRRIGPAAGYPEMLWLANNLVGGTARDSCRNRLLASTALDGGVLEFWLQNPGGWEPQMEQSFLIQANNWPAMYWLKWNQLAKHLTLDQYKRFAYGSLLLTWQPATTRMQAGGPFGLNPPDRLFFWDWGNPMETAASLADAPRMDCGGVPVYRRRFENGLILVNPGEKDAVCSLESEHHDVSGELRTTAAPTVKSRDAVFLWRMR